MAMCGIDDDHVAAGLQQAFGPGHPLVADGRRRGDAEPPLVVLAGMRIEARLFDVFYGDEANAILLGIDDEELFNAVVMEEPLRLLLAHSVADPHQVLMRHQFGDALIRVGGEAHVAIGEDADQPADYQSAGAAVLHDRNTRYAVGLH
jgi:hypothetical protein